MKIHNKLLTALILGMSLGIVFHAVGESSILSLISANILYPIGQIFLSLIFMVVVPMVFSALTIGVYELGRGSGLGKVAAKTFYYTVLASSASVLIGIGLVNYFKPGEGFKIEVAKDSLATNTTAFEIVQKNADSAKTFAQSIIDLIPKNPLASATQALDGEMIPLMVFALLFGFALALAHNKRSQTSSTATSSEPLLVIQFLEQIYEASMTIVEQTMKVAPFAVFAIVFNTAFKFGPQIFASLIFYVAVVLGGLLIQQFIVYSLLLKFIAKRSPSDFFRKCKDVYLYAFATASSNATLPRSLETADKKLRISPKISRFVLTIGSVANQNGTALFEGITVLFLAQVYGVDLSITQQTQVVLLSILAGIGTAGVPGGSLPLIMILLQQLNIPAEGIGLILGVDRFLDMCRTTLNVSGDLVIAALVDSKSSKNTEKLSTV
ncbi:MAG: dicarboxylate/amino acid:cation symporter [Pseudobdellovibrionaceae bacterium]